MPVGCATWPAIWEAGLENWPNDGEIDIVEGADSVGPNSMTVWASSGCTVPDGRDQSGTIEGNNCDANVDSGCAVWDSHQNSFGPPFNANGGGWFAMERTDSFIKVWFWPRDSTPPAEVQDGSLTINTDTWVSSLLEDSVQSQIFTLLLLCRVPRLPSSPTTMGAISVKSSQPTTSSST